MMKNQKQRVNRRFISVEKLQSVLSNLCTELASGSENMRVGRTDNAIVIYANGGTVNISFNEKGGSHE